MTKEEKAAHRQRYHIRMGRGYLPAFWWMWRFARELRRGQLSRDCIFLAIAIVEHPDCPPNVRAVLPGLSQRILDAGRRRRMAIWKVSAA